MRDWKTPGVEPGIEELLDDEIMVPVMRSAGLCVGDLRVLVTETAERLHHEAERSGRRPVN